MAAQVAMMLPSLQELQSSDQIELLDVIDSLRAQGLSQIISLPQLVVCGDQSSGKSSVLEAISGVPFPRKDNLCTRFATEVILRRDSKTSISVSIVPSKDRSSSEREIISQFRHELATLDDFPALFEKAKDIMGLSDDSKSFSRDVLRIEMLGPTQPQLTLVDLPGLIHSETKSQTPADISMVTNLVSEYLTSPRSIILAVVSAKNDISNQIVLRRSREVDRQGDRTLGIITKPDCLDHNSSSEGAFLALAKNEEIPFELGWHTVKNLAPAEQGDRDAIEAAFFETSNFQNLPSENIGIISLRARLSKILFDQIRFELPKLIEDIDTRIIKTKAEVEKLGTGRATLQEQRNFLITVSEEFHSICRDAIRGDYHHAFFKVDSSPERRLCADVRNQYFKFAKTLREDGARWKITEDEQNLFGLSPGTRTRKQAINEVCKLLERSRGPEVNIMLDSTSHSSYRLV